MPLSTEHVQRETNDKITPIILCGGFGKRLWPLSRPYWPKPFLAFSDDESLLQKTVKRFSGPLFHNPVIICNEEHRFGVATQMHTAGVTPQAILLEPKSTGTTAAILFAAHFLSQRGYNGNIVVTPADHAIESSKAFQDTIEAAVQFTPDHDLILLGIQPSHPSSDFGYLTIGSDEILDALQCHEVKSFIEKPSESNAQTLLDSGRSYWNAGVFIFDLMKLLDVADTLATETNNASARAVKNASVNEDFIRLEAEAVSKIDCPSFDISIVQKCSQVGMLQFTDEWRDMGTWKSVWASSSKDKNGNVHLGNTVSSHVKNSIIMSDGINIGVGGLEGITVIAAGNHVSISPLDDPMMSSVLADLQNQKVDAGSSLTPTKLHRAWGAFEILRTEANFQIKKLTVDPNSRLSLQRHQHRSEHWVVISGRATVTINETTKDLLPSQSTYVPKGTPHRLANNQSTPLIIIELQIGDYLGEDDIERIEDDYQRY